MKQRQSKQKLHFLIKSDANILFTTLSRIEFSNINFLVGNVSKCIISFTVDNPIEEIRNLLLKRNSYNHNSNNKFV